MLRTGQPVEVERTAFIAFVEKDQVSGDCHVVSTWENNLIPVVFDLKLKSSFSAVVIYLQGLSYKIDFENVDRSLPQ